MGKVRKHRRAKARIPLAIVGGLAPAALFAYHGFTGEEGHGSGIDGLTHNLVEVTTGYQTDTGRWAPGDNMVPRLVMPLALGFVVHKLVARLGINRMISRAGIPFVSI